MAIPDFELMDGVRVELFGEYQLRIELLSAGKVEQQWINPHGKLQKSVPASVKDNYTEFARLNLIREQVKQIKQISAAQRGRLERFFLEDRSWDMASFEQCYLKHGLVSRLAIRLIWLVDDQPCVYHSSQWQNAQAEPVEVSSSSTVAIWHPIHSDSATVLAWRSRLQALEIQQPFKQAHREIYIVTDAERQTGDYSNRMAAHIVKQYSMNALAVSRGWQYSLIGPFDGGDYAEVNRSIPAYELNARLVIHDVKEESVSLSDAGMYLYVSTDQLSFLQAGQTVELEDVPPMVFSEIVRDVDLFVGVGSVASDPYWEDSGHSENYTQYWQAHGFGDLGEFAKTRKQVLEQLLPKLKIRDVASIDGKYLVIQGVRCSYKIHIGSSNVLMQPDNRYLCIVPAAAKARPSKVFLPFEGDTVLAIILSKAFLLAADDKIEDPAILSQFAGQSPDG